MKKRWIYLLIVALLLAVVAAIVLLRPDQAERIARLRKEADTYLVVTRAALAPALAPWRERREKQGFTVVIRAFDGAPTVEEIRTWIAAENRQGHRCRYIMLVGDCAAPAESEAAWHLPSISGPLGYPYEGQTTAIVTDAPYGDIDQDGREEVAVGRLPVRDGDQLHLLIAKMIQFEERPVEPSFYRALLWTGAKYYHAPMHRLTLQFAEQMLPDYLYPQLISSNPASACSGPLEEQPQRFLEALAEPAFITLVVTHGSYNNLRAAQREAGTEIPLTAEAVAAGLPSSTAVGPLMLLACETGSFYLPTAKGPSISETFLLHPGGPVAVVASTGIVNALTNFYMAAAIANNMKDGAAASIGDLLLDSRLWLYEVGKYSLNQIRSHDPRARGLLQSIPVEDKAFFETKGLIRNERLHYNLLGDPGLRFNRPRPMTVQAQPDDRARIHLTGAVPEAADNLWVQQIDPERLHATVPPQVSDDQRRTLFQQAHEPPHLLARQQLNGDRWEVALEVQRLQENAGRSIRVMAMGQGRYYYNTFAWPLQNQEAKRF
ncbi:MAG: hypothetical protein HZB24_02855 [Desulfobacterales bacterium]|nr:hypothetical protein [Desulfobacterales bacterium]